MKEYTTEFIRNVALIAHGGAGKTMLGEAFLHLTGATTRLGKIEDGTTVSDYDEEEIRRQISISTSVLPIEYGNFKVNVLDAPGYTDFIGEAISAMSVADGALVLVDSVAGVEVGTELAWRYANQFKLPRFVVINKLDRENANYEKAYASVESYAQAFDARIIKAQLPIGEKHDFKGVIDLIGMKAYLGTSKDPVEIPAEYKDAAEEAHFQLVEAAAEGEDSLLEKYLESGALTDEELVSGLHKVVQNGSFIPVFCAAGAHELGVFPLLKAIVDLMPAPSEHPTIKAHGSTGDEELSTSDTGPAALYVWKTTADPFVGKMTYFKVISGTLANDSRLWNKNRNIEERISVLHAQRGK